VGSRRPDDARYLALAYALPRAYAAAAYGAVCILDLGTFSVAALPAGQSLPTFLALNATVCSSSKPLIP
jgi:hypothetical protein